jgi:hypothetical protein
VSKIGVFTHARTLEPSVIADLDTLLTALYVELEIGWRPDEMVQVRAGDLDNALLVAVCALYEVERRIETAQQPAHQADPDRDGRGMRWLGPGQVCSFGTERSGTALSFPTRAGRSAERGDFEAG